MFEISSVSAGILCLVTSPTAPESPRILSGIANCSWAPPAIREWCVIRLIERHAKPGMTLDELTRLLDHPTWLSKDYVDYTELRILTGHFPVGIEPGQTTVAIDIKIPNRNNYRSLWIRLSGGWWYGGTAAYVLRKGKRTSDKSRVVEAIGVFGITF
jgi:hypothetical protein